MNILKTRHDILLILTLLINSMIVGIVIGVLIIGIVILTLDTNYQNDGIAGITLILSLGSGVIITLIVNDKSQKSHLEVISSQKTITTLLKKLDETDKKHQEVLTLLEESKENNEKRAKETLDVNLCYIVNMLEKIFKHVDETKIKQSDFDLIGYVLKHLESSINLTMQSLHMIATQIPDYKKTEISSSLEILRKIVIASMIVDDENWKRTGELLKQSFQKLKKLSDTI